MKSLTHAGRAAPPLGWIGALVIGACCAVSARAELPSEVSHGPQAATLAVPASKHWVWVNDFVFPHMADGMAYLVDGDTGRYLGTLSTGYSYAHLLLSGDGKLIYSPETYFSRGTRGKRTDVVTLYDAGTLNVIGEIDIPPKRSSNLPMMANAVLTDDESGAVGYGGGYGQKEVRARGREPGMRPHLSDRTAFVFYGMRRRRAIVGGTR